MLVFVLDCKNSSKSVATRTSYFSLLAAAQITDKPTSGSVRAEEESASFAYEVTNQSEPLGLYEPYAKIYVTTDPIPHLPLYLALVTVNQIHKLVYSKSSGMNEKHCNFTIHLSFF
jgi:hypothetical protein